MPGTFRMAQIDFGGRLCEVHERIKRWFETQGWHLFPFQKESIKTYDRYATRLIHAPTGLGKTAAALLPVIQNRLEREESENLGKLQVLWITPLRALASDTVISIQNMLAGCEMNWRVEDRTGDTKASIKARQKKKLPEVLVTTPESLSLLLSFPETRDLFKQISDVIIDEWHELLSSKRGVQTELGIARLRTWRPELKVCGLSATLANLKEAAEVLDGNPRYRNGDYHIIKGKTRKRIEIRSIMPRSVSLFPWSGHLGLSLLPQVVKELEKSQTSLVFTNTRSQTELWFQGILEARPEWTDKMAIHHGSIDKTERDLVEAKLKSGDLKVVVCTSSLDLGVDFHPVEVVFQIGGPKGVARLLQRAGRSGHQPGKVSRIFCVPTHSLELIEYAAVRESIRKKIIEPRRPIEKPLDLLSQHIVTICLGGPASYEELFTEISRTYSYRNISKDEFNWVIQFIQFGGKALKAYDQFSKLVLGEDGRYFVKKGNISKFHRLSIGTITSDTAVSIKLQSGKTLGSIEENFISKFKPGWTFVFSGQALELIKFYGNTAIVKKSKTKRLHVPAWQGGNAPLSSELADAVFDQFMIFQNSETKQIGPELKKVSPLLRRQAKESKLPQSDELLMECTTIKGIQSWFFYTFGGRFVHEGLASLIAHRITMAHQLTVVISVNDYGFHLAINKPMQWNHEDWRQFFSPEIDLAELMGCINSSELAKRKFREIARVAGLIFSGYPGANKSVKHIQISSQILYDVFTQYEPDHLLLNQAKNEVIQLQLEFKRINSILHRIDNQKICIRKTQNLSPLSFPLWAEMIRGEVSSEPWLDRVKAMANELGKEAEI